ncbi:uncharacterized protein DUF4262 [Mucilaginibacter yixingensis]|uniref:Uncharacterized protein DUF4262 n=1 Tax=Mucilaginibacter yixingensis TaxID=1295612 RepID=A0A2T5JEY9_9SPHI|nr:DUF4262 domain-containing protein [Mucilaginibacter yixingensis]PTR00954.1 uncharacterized protein DUF4262 [Mucilaginibacter yixingensis]
MTDEHEKHDQETKDLIIANVEKYGCHLAMFEATGHLPAFVYSIGLFKAYGHPEIICFGLDINLMATLINDAKAQIQAGKSFSAGERSVDFLKGFDVQFIEVNKAFASYLGYAGWFYGNFEFPVLQLVWPDKERHFPWDADFNAKWKFKQPLLDRNTDFWFYEERNVCAYTTKQALEGDPILFVYHNIDGDWQFHTSEEPQINDGKLVALQELVKLDPTLNKVYHLAYGWCAWRDSVDDNWEYEQFEFEEEE